MSRLCRCLPVGALFAGTLVLLVIGGSSQSDDDAKKKERDERLQEMRQRAGSIKAYRITKDARVPVASVEEPLLRFNAGIARAFQ